MEQLNNALSPIEEENKEAVATIPKGIETTLLDKVRQKFEITGLISLIFGLMFTLSFYEAEFGMNAFFFTGVMVIQLVVVMKRFVIPMKKATYLYYGASLLLGLSSTMTSNGSIQFMNTIGTIFLLNLSILHQLHEDGKWEFAEHFGKMIAMLFHGLAAVPYPFIDSVRYMKRTKFFKNDRVRNMFVGILISIPILWLVIALLAGADMVFSDMTTRIFEKFASPELFWMTFMVLFGFFSCYCILCGAAAQTGQKERTSRKKGSAVTAETVMFLICVVYAVFCGFQIVYLFAGGFFALPEGITFSEYARGGFFQLLAVTIINVILMVLCTTLFEDSKLLRILLTLMTACTYIMIFSATYRMILYVDAYQLTFLRVLVLLALLIIAFILAGVIRSVYKKNFPLFRYSVAVITICYLVFSLTKPDYWIATYFLQQKEVMEEEDAMFLTQELSLDAAPVVIPLFQDVSRWGDLSVIKIDKDGMHDTYLVTDTPKDDLSVLDYYGITYYMKIQSENRRRGLKDFNVSITNALQCMEQNPIRHYSD